jgi:hypothetical protein
MAAEPADKRSIPNGPPLRPDRQHAGAWTRLWDLLLRDPRQAKAAASTEKAGQVKNTRPASSS